MGILGAVNIYLYEENREIVPLENCPRDIYPQENSKKYWVLTAKNIKYSIIYFFILLQSFGQGSSSCYPLRVMLHKKMKFSIKDIFSKCDQIRRKMRIWSHLLKKSLMETSFFVQCCNRNGLWLWRHPRKIVPGCLI